MSRSLSNYQRFVGEELRKLPKDSTPQERGRALRRAAADWQARKGGHSVRSNPGGGNLAQLAVIGGLIYIGLKLLGKQPGQTA